MTPPQSADAKNYLCSLSHSVRSRGLFQFHRLLLLLCRAHRSGKFTLTEMGSCFSSLTNQQGQNQGGPASYAAAVAQNAAHAVSDIIQQGTSTSASVHQTDPPGLQVIENVYVFKMPDGDTFSCDYIDRAGQKATSRVRIMAIDCPESSQNFGQDARQIGEKMIFRTRVTLHVHTTDRYGRLVADVITQNGLNFGKEMLRQGAAWHYKAYDKRPAYAQLEEQARAQQIGLWSYPRPQAPWDYRRRQRER